jgi:putative flippase GtrA
MIDKAKVLFAKLLMALSDRKRLKELAMYILFGVATTAVNWGIYVALTSIFGLQQMDEGTWQHKLVSNGSNVSAWILGVLFAFFTNRKFVFHSNAGTRGSRWREFLMFVSARIASYVLFDFALFNFSIYYLGIGDRFAKLLMNVLVVIFNYFASRYLVFRKGEGK